MIEISDVVSCAHERAVPEVVDRQAAPGAETPPTGGMIHRTVCPDCGMWAASIQGPVRLYPTVITAPEEEISR